MNPLFIHSTNYTPEVLFTPEGKLSVTGKSFPEDTASFYQPLHQWITDCSVEQVEFLIKLDYINSSSAQQVSKLLLLAKDNPNIRNTVVNWYHETEDEESFEFGKELEYITEFQFNFYKYTGIGA